MNLVFWTRSCRWFIVLRSRTNMLKTVVYVHVGFELAIFSLQTEWLLKHISVKPWSGWASPIKNEVYIDKELEESQIVLILITSVVKFCINTWGLRRGHLPSWQLKWCWIYFFVFVCKGVFSFWCLFCSLSVAIF